MVDIKGKTKRITGLIGDVGVVETFDDITAGDGAKHDIMLGKAELATRTTCNVFERLANEGIPMAYIGRDGRTTFLTTICKMIPVEVVVRAVATGSYLKRNPEYEDGHVFEEPVVEYFYKTNRRRIGSNTIPCDDPLMVLNEDGTGYDLYLPNKPQTEGFIGSLNDWSDGNPGVSLVQLAECGEKAVEIFIELAVAWGELGGTLYDFKVEFGVMPDGTIALADVLDCDSWRVLLTELDENGIQLSKQPYRDGADLDKVLAIYRLAASLTDQMLHWA